MVFVAYKPMNLIVLVSLLVTAIPFFHPGRRRAPLLPETEEPMTTIDFLTVLFYEVDEQLCPLPNILRSISSSL